MANSEGKNVVVVGLGYVGLPVALLAAERGYIVMGYDINTEKVQLVNNGKSPLEDDQLSKALVKRPITATTDAKCVAEADVVIIAVPTPVTESKEPDLNPLTSALEAVLPHLHSGQLISIESTINPGVMDSVIAPLLAEWRDLAVDVVHCPERINPGDTKWTVRTIPRVIGGLTPAATKRGKKFYEQILDAPVKEMASATEAEAVKILENTFRDVNIAFVNEMAKSFDKLGIDITNVIAGAATKPFAYMPHYPGNGVGGHCISVDPYYMIQRGRQAGFDHEFLQLARNINDAMPQYTVDRLSEAMQLCSLLPSQATVTLLGVTYKKNIDDVRESPALAILHLLQKMEVKDLRVFDPHVPESSTVDSLEGALTGSDAIVIGTDHDEFLSGLTPTRLSEYGIKIVVDGKNTLNADGIAGAGIIYRGIGRMRDPK